MRIGFALHYYPRDGHGGFLGGSVYPTRAEAEAAQATLGAGYTTVVEVVPA